MIARALGQVAGDAQGSKGCRSTSSRPPSRSDARAVKPGLRAEHGDHRQGDGRPDATRRCPRSAVVRRAEGEPIGWRGFPRHPGRTDEDHRARDDPPGRVRQPHLGSPAHRRGPRRPGRDLHGGRARSRPTCTRPSAPKLVGHRSARDRGAQRARSRTIWAGARPASRPAATRPSTSRCGTCSARRTGSPVRDMLGGRSRDSHPRLQHLRRLPLHPRRARAGGRQLACRASRAVRTRTSTPSCIAPTSSPSRCSSRASPA